MAENRNERLVEKLEKGISKSMEVFSRLEGDQWQLAVYQEPVWTVRHLLAHFVYSERDQLLIYQSVSKGGPGVEEDIDIDQYNAEEQKKIEGVEPQALMEMLKQARQKTISWVHSLREEDLNKIGRHPALGDISVEIMVEAIYGHQLLHMRDLSRVLHGPEGQQT